MAPPAACLADYGNTECAALIYSQMVCDPSRAAMPAGQLNQQLEQSFRAAGLSTGQLQVEAVVNTALNRFIPSLCPELLQTLQELRR